MLPLNDKKWNELNGGYGMPYNPTIDLLRLEKGEDVWDTLWENLHHQGDVGEGSYAAVPELVRIMKARPSRDWNLYSLISTIEIERHRKKNPRLPGWLAQSYMQAWAELLELALSDLRHVGDPLSVQSIVGAIALAKGHLELAALISHADASEISKSLEESHAWSELYNPPE